MTGPRILALVLLAAAVLLWSALFGGADQDLARGLEESEHVFQLIEHELLELDPVYKEVTRRGLMLNLKRKHDSIRSQLATLRARQRHIVRDENLDRRERLPAFRELRDRGDDLLALAIGLRREVTTRYDFMKSISPQLAEARRLDELLHANVPDDPALLALVQSLSGSLSDVESGTRRSDTLMQQNLQQGLVLGEATRKQLESLLDEQRALLEKLPGEPAGGG